MMKATKYSKASGTLFYSLINITYYMSFCAIHAFAAVYLLDKGFSNSIIGVLLAIANIFSALLQPFVASLIDKYSHITNRGVSMLSAFILVLGAVILLMTGNITAVVFIVFTIMYMIQFTYMPVLTALSFEYRQKGTDIIFGLARGLGSAGFAIMSAFIGNLVEKKGVDCLLIASIIAGLIHILLLYLFKEPTSVNNDISTSDSSDTAEVSHSSTTDSCEASLSLTGFIKTYPIFISLLAATILLFFTHNMLNDYLIQIIRNIGGSETNLGLATFLAALLELPAMTLVSLVSNKVSMRKLLILSGIFFTVKSVIMLFAVNMFMVYLSQAMQMFAYAVFIPASAYFVGNNVAQKDQVKGQALITSCFTLSGVFSSLICGVILDTKGVNTMLITGVIISIIGTITIIFSMLHKKPTAC